MSDRDAFREARDAGLAKRHESRLQRATYTAAEVKVLTEAATRVALELGRREAASEISEHLLAEADERERGASRGSIWAAINANAFRTAAGMAHSWTLPGSGATSDATSGVPEGPGVTCPDCGLTDDHKGGCPQTGEAPQPGAPG